MGGAVSRNSGISNRRMRACHASQPLAFKQDELGAALPIPPWFCPGPAEKNRSGLPVPHCHRENDCGQSVRAKMNEDYTYL